MRRGVGDAGSIPRDLSHASHSEAATEERRQTNSKLRDVLLLTVYRNTATLLLQIIYMSNREDEFTADLLQGTLDLLVLKALAAQPLHGLGVSTRINQITKGTFDVKPGSLFPALHRMEEAGWLKAEWGESENNRRAKFYSLTKAGRRQLETETEDWQRISLAIGSALRAI
jgi:PadR family transcriptional regulator, regulatory protein PadR